MIEQTYRIDMIPDGAPVVVHVSQYDTAARRLSFELYNGGVAYELPAGAVASIAGTKPDNTPFLYAMTVSGNLVSIDLQQQMALVAGDVPAEIQITGAEGKIGSANFIIRVERGPIDENSVISETDLPIFEQLVSDAQAAANEAQTAAEDAADAAESVGSIVPASTGTAGQVLTKTANGADWADKYPSGGTTGQVLTKTANGEAWDDVDGLPSGGTAGQVLTKNSSTSGDASWQTPQSGGGGTWGSITGTLSDQTDLNNALNAKANASNLATIESSTTASQAYSAGDYLVLNGQLYEVTAAISSGETLTVGTNISATTVGSELTALNNSLVVFPNYSDKIYDSGTVQSGYAIYTATQDCMIFVTLFDTSRQYRSIYVNDEIVFAHAISGNGSTTPSAVPFSLMLKAGDVVRTDTTSPFSASHFFNARAFSLIR